MRSDNSYEVRRAGSKRDGLVRNETITLPYPVHGPKSPARRPARRLYRRRASHHAQRDGGAGRRDQCLRRAGADPADRLVPDPGLLPSLRHESRLPRRERARALVAPHPGRRRTHRWAVGTVRIGEDPGPRHSGSDGGNPHRPQSHRGAGGGAQAAVLRDRHRHGRSIRRRGTDHCDGRSVRLGVCPGVPSVASGAQDTATVLLMRRSILTEKLARRGRHVTREYGVNPLHVLRVEDVMDPPVAPPTAAVGPVVTYPDELLETAMQKLLEHELYVLPVARDRKSTRLNSSHSQISYAV